MQVSSPAVPRPRCAAKFYRPSDPVPMRVLYRQIFDNIGHEVPCEWDCTIVVVTGPFIIFLLHNHFITDNFLKKNPAM
jgi:hypothetical protein